MIKRKPAPHAQAAARAISLKRCRAAHRFSRARFLMKVIGGRVVARDDEGARLRLLTRVRLHAGVSLAAPLTRRGVPGWHDYFIILLRRWSIPALRLTLGLVFLWFGALKLLGVSPVMKILEHTYGFLPVWSFALAIGAWEVLVGLGLLLKWALRCTVSLLCLHLAGTFAALVLAPTLFFHDGNPLWLTVEGEFVVKNMVLISAALVIGGHEVEPLCRRRT